jgi:hypothetical protein
MRGQRSVSQSAVRYLRTDLSFEQIRRNQNNYGNPTRVVLSTFDTRFEPRALEAKFEV